jgi:hypothetical protein
MKDDIIKRVLDTSNEQFEWVSGACLLNESIEEVTTEAERAFGKNANTPDAILIAAAIARLECTVAAFADRFTTQ